MISTYFKRILIFFLVAAALLASFAAAAGSGTLAVNPDGEVIGSDLSKVYAIGGGGTSILGSARVWALTAKGLEEIGEASAGTENPGPGPIDPEDLDIPPLPVSGTIKVPATKLRVGLFFYHTTASRDTSLISANLQNYVGRGYELGYYNDNREFVSLKATFSQDKLSMLKDRNMYYYASGNTYYEGTGGSVVVGCFHVRLPGSYKSYQDALDALSGLPEDTFVKYSNGSFYAMAGNYTSYNDAAAAMDRLQIKDASVDSGTAYTVTMVETGTSDILFEFDCGASSSLAVRPLGQGKKAETWFKGYRYYGDFEYKRLNGGNLTVVNIVDVEDYVKGVLPYEVSNSWPMETLKAQAVCARTYGMKNVNGYKSFGFDLTNDTYCQVYRGTLSAGTNTDTAVDQTAGVYAVYDGSLCHTLFYSSNGGSTEDNVNVYGNDFAYLKGVYDPFEAAVEDMIPNYRWTYKMTPAKLTASLKSYNLATVASVTPTYSETGNTISLLVRDVNGKTATVTKGSCRTSLSLPSIHYTVEWSEREKVYVFEGSGLGHNVGMSQYGAYSMAKNYGYTYDQILNFYYRGISLRTGTAN